MKSLVAVHDVILRADLPPRERELLSHLAIKLTAPDLPGQELLCLPCTRIDTSHHVYLQLETFRPDDEVTVEIQIPHQYVLLISGSESRRTIGFMAQD